MQAIDLTRLDDFTTAFIECALWSSTDRSDDSGGSPLDDNYGPEDIEPGTLAEMVRECEEFQAGNRAHLDAAEMTDEQAGHDFWLTRNRHGAGFWDRGLGKVGQLLTDAAHAYGSVDLYVTDSGTIAA